MSTTEIEIREQLEQIERNSLPLDFEPALQSFLQARSGPGSIEIQLSTLLHQIKYHSDGNLKRRCESLIESMIEIDTDVTISI